MKLKYLGERKIIDLISSITNTDITDDCAILELGKNYILVTTDMINEETHVPKGANAYQVGWHLVAINLSDLAAKGARPLGIVAALGLPKGHSAEFVEELATGMKECCERYSTKIIGGDTKDSMHVTAAGAG